MDSNTIITGEQLRKIRLKRGYSQGQLSKMIGVPVTSISKIENDHWSISVEMLNKFAEALKFKVNFDLTDIQHTALEVL